MPLASLDLFDTVLHRPHALLPEDVFRRTGLRIAEPGFTSLRIRAERLAAQRALNQEATLAEIYAAFAEVSGWPRARVDAARDAELAEEAELLPIASAASLIAKLRSERWSIAYLSDMYLPGEFLENILRRHGLWQEGDRLAVSCELRASKRFGTCFPLLQRDWHGWTRHYGDNEQADIRNARIHGLDTVLLPAGRPTERERILHRIDPECAARARSARLRCEEPEDPHVALGAALSGPIGTAFMHWVADGAARKGCEAVYCLAREGQLLASLAPTGTPTRYLELSRQALVLALLDATAPHLEEWMLDCDERNLAGVFANLGVTPPAEIDHEALNRRRAWNAADRALLLDMLRAPALWDQVQARSGSQRAGLAAHLRAIGLTSHTRVALVDLGWSCTIQEMLQRVLAQQGADVRMQGFYLGLKRRREGCEAEGFLDTDQFRASLLGYEPVAEALFPADHGQVFHHDPQGRAVYHAHTMFSATATRRLQEAARKYAEGPPPPLGPAQAAALLRSFVRGPRRSEADALGSARYSCGITPGTQLAPVAPGVSRLRAALRTSAWQPGLLSRLGLPVSEASGTALSLALKVAVRLRSLLRRARGLRTGSAW